MGVNRFGMEVRMGRFKKKFGRHILAYLLSGAMIMSGMTSFASEPVENTGGGIMTGR